MGTVSSSLCQNMTACGVPLQMWEEAAASFTAPSLFTSLRPQTGTPVSQNSFHFQTFSFQLGFGHLANSQTFCWALILKWMRILPMQHFLWYGTWASWCPSTGMVGGGSDDTDPDLLPDSDVSCSSVFIFRRSSQPIHSFFGAFSFLSHTPWLILKCAASNMPCFRSLTFC